jgi:hypothetical protein
MGEMVFFKSQFGRNLAVEECLVKPIYYKISERPSRDQARASFLIKAAGSLRGNANVGPHYTRSQG